ncbi:copper resistance protein [Aliidongia dinghuensis]|uniref:Copper resistance protein n=1 Tax=Aliidongia dinghuensis TaxID=1867774 RepID=A0A8J2YQU2_9PROT|nr:CopD family protein [Aliidongia dinghuensis]GGF06821.1 copper resistance protein [Aliidongia dinghuensis]
MALLIDLFGYLSVILHGLTIVAQSMALGGILFLIFLARPFADALGTVGDDILRRTRRIAGWAAVALIVCEAATIALQGAVLIGTVDLSFADVMSADFAIAGQIKILAAALLVVLAFGFPNTPRPVLAGVVLLELAAATLTTHANARLEDRVPLLIVEGLHQLGAAIWIGGIPSFIMALGRCHDGMAWRKVGKRFSQMSTVGVACILVSGATMTYLYVGDLPGFYGTAYGVMVGAKMAMFAGLLCLGAMNYLLVERLRTNPATPITRLKRFAEVEIGIGFTLFFAAASLTSVAPAIDLSTDRVTWNEIVERNTPQMPVLTSPDHAALALPALQQKLDQEAEAQKKNPPPAFVPGSGDLPPRNLDDIRWSEYNHHWAGLFVLLMGVLALANQAKLARPVTKHWPLVLLGLAVFLFLRSDPEVWPLGEEGFWESFRDVEVVQHRMFVALTVIFGLFEWRVRVGGLAKTKAALVFPIMTALGGALLLTHQHAIANVKDQLLIELTHTPLALASVALGWSRWLEIRLDPPGNKIAGWIWPACFIFIGFLLLSYREI